MSMTTDLELGRIASAMTRGMGVLEAVLAPVDEDTEIEEANQQAIYEATKQRKERRERIAIAAMQGFLARENTFSPVYPQVVVTYAVEHADALIAELDK